MKTQAKYSASLASLVMLGAATLVAVLPAQAAAQAHAVLYELVENLDTVALTNTGHRISYWTAQGTAQAGTPFCPLPVGSPPCTITAFGMDDIDVNPNSPTYLTGRVWANIAAVANPIEDNPVDGAEAVFRSGQITGAITIFPPSGGATLAPELGKKKKALGPALPLLYVTEGKFFLDQQPTVRTTPPVDLPTGDPTATFDSTFRLPFKVGKQGPEPAERGKNAFYLADDGSLVKVDKQDEVALGFPLLRAEVRFK
jgi:hypothetical protein